MILPNFVCEFITNCLSFSHNWAPISVGRISMDLLTILHFSIFINSIKPYLFQCNKKVLINHWNNVPLCQTSLLHTIIFLNLDAALIRHGLNLYTTKKDLVNGMSFPFMTGKTDTASGLLQMRTNMFNGKMLCCFLCFNINEI